MSITAVIGSATDPSRTSGKAPLAVFFNANGTRSTAEDTETKARKHLLFYWDFDDPGAGNWPDVGQGNRSKNYAEGPDACHIYETAGTYHPVLKATDGVTVSTVNCDAITVSAYPVDSTTHCFANGTTAGGAFANAPSGATLHESWTDFDNAITTYLATDRRLLFRCGDTFNVNTSPGIAGSTGWCVGSFDPGAGANPIVQLSGNMGTVLYAQDVGGADNVSDLRYMDLQVNPNGHTGTLCGTGGGNYLAHRSTFLRCVSTSTWGNSIAIDARTGRSGQNAQCVFAECSGDTTDNYCQYAFSSFEQAWLGCAFSYSGAQSDLGEGLFRCEGHTTLIMQHNHFTGGQVGRPQEKLNSASIATSTRLTFSDNKCNFGYGAFPFDIAPQGGAGSEFLKDFIVERNWFVSSLQTWRAVNISATQGVIRNNLFDSTLLNTGAGTLYSIYIDQLEVETAPAGVEVYNNTSYSGGSHATLDFTQVYVGTPCTTITVKNNLISAAGLDVVSSLEDHGTGTTQSNNRATDTPGFVSGSPSVPTDFKLDVGSSSIGGGATVTVGKDYFGTWRYGATYDQGFHQYTAGSDPGGAGGALLTRLHTEGLFAGA